jgi:hypothetical protein
MKRVTDVKLGKRGSSSSSRSLEPVNGARQVGCSLPLGPVASAAAIQLLPWGVL